MFVDYSRLLLLPVVVSVRLYTTKSNHNDNNNEKEERFVGGVGVFVILFRLSACAEKSNSCWVSFVCERATTHDRYIDSFLPCF